MRHLLGTPFFDRSTLTVARELLGKFLVKKNGNKEIASEICEVEAYVGPRDRASHASRGKTERTKIMFMSAGHWYVYLIYGMYHCLNIVTEREGYPAAILIRSVAGAKGPGRVCRLFKIGKEFNGLQASKKSGLWIEDRGIIINPRKIRRGERIGVEYAKEWREKKWRFYLK